MNWNGSSKCTSFPVNAFSSMPTNNAWTSFNRQIGVIIIRVLYGYHARTHEDPFLKAPLEHLEYFGEGTLPGAFLVDTFPQRAQQCVPVFLQTY